MSKAIWRHTHSNQIALRHNLRDEYLSVIPCHSQPAKTSFTFLPLPSRSFPCPLHSPRSCKQLVHERHSLATILRRIPIVRSSVVAIAAVRVSRIAVRLNLAVVVAAVLASWA